jgi:hypothetical protein
MENSEKENINVRMEDMNARDNPKSRTYWYMVTPNEKELIGRYRRNELQITLNKKPPHTLDK